MIIGKINSTSAQPYYHGLKAFGHFVPFPVGAGVLPDLIQRGKVLAGPVNAYDYFRLQKEGCTPLSDFGLFLNPYVVNKIDITAASGARAALLHAPYILLIRRPIEEYETLNIGISPEAVSTGTDAMLLLKILLGFHWELPHTINNDLSVDDDAWLMPGGPYLQVNSSAFFGFPYAYDLSWEWYRWQKTPFMFYRWICSPELEPALRDQLIVALRRTLENNLRNLPELASHEAAARGVERTETLTFMQGFSHRLGLWERSAEASAEKLVSLMKAETLLHLDPSQNS